MTSHEDDRALVIVMLTLLVIMLLLFGCGRDDRAHGTPVDPSVWMPMWTRAVECAPFPASTPPPRTVLVNTQAWISDSAGRPARGVYFEDEQAVVVVEPTWPLIGHEMIHHGLARTTGHADAGHQGPAWAACSV